MYKDLKRSCRAIVLLIKPFVWRRFLPLLFLNGSYCYVVVPLFSCKNRQSRTTFKANKRCRKSTEKCYSIRHWVFQEIQTGILGRMEIARFLSQADFNYLQLTYLFAILYFQLRAK